MTNVDTTKDQLAAAFGGRTPEDVLRNQVPGNASEVDAVNKMLEALGHVNQSVDMHRYMMQFPAYAHLYGEVKRLQKEVDAEWFSVVESNDLHVMRGRKMMIESVAQLFPSDEDLEAVELPHQANNADNSEGAREDNAQNEPAPKAGTGTTVTSQSTVRKKEHAKTRKRTSSPNA